MGLEAPKIRKTAAVLQDHSDLQGCGFFDEYDYLTNSAKNIDIIYIL